VKLEQRKCACGCSLTLRVKVGAPMDSNHIYGSSACREKMEGVAELKFHRRHGIDGERKRIFQTRVMTLLGDGLTHREIAARLEAEGTLSVKGRIPTERTVTNYIARRMAWRLREERKGKHE
jgi:hypothetical protein